MTFEIKNVVVIDDALGAPARGTVDASDKDAWMDFVSGSPEAQRTLGGELYSGNPPSLDAMLEDLTGQRARLEQLWTLHSLGKLAEAKLEVLFRGATLYRNGKIEKAETVLNKLRAMVGPSNVYPFPDIKSAADALKSADIAFVDFYLSNSESEDAAIERITAAASVLKLPKLLFFMSSRASLDVQQSVRRKIGVRTAFFEVMRKGDITPEFIEAKVEAKRAAYASNQSIQGLVEELVKSTRVALSEFEAECEELEVHDLRMLDLARLDAEGETLGEYLTWLFSESIAAKTRKLAFPAATQKQIPFETIGFTGQIRQGKVLSELFSKVVFGPAVMAEKPIRFGELLRSREDQSKYLLVLTPACDLQRCEPSKAVLCVEGKGETYVGSKALAREKLYGKQDDGRLCHLYTTDGSSGSSTMINWKRDQIVTRTVKDFGSNEFERVALMNELFAQEVKEEVLRTLGRVGTQIDPPPSIALYGKIRWKRDGKNYLEETSPRDDFVSALLSYSEQKDEKNESDRKKSPTIVLSDEFKLWMRAKIEGSVLEGEVLHVKMQNCLKTALSSKQFQLAKGFVVKMQELCVKVQESDEPELPDNNAFLEITLRPI